MSLLNCLMVALSAQGAGAPSPSPSASALTADAAATLLQRSPAFTGAHGDRRFVRVRQIRRFQEATQEGWLVEFEWTERGKTRKGVAPVTHAGAPHDEPWYFAQDGLAVVAVVQDKSIDDLVTAMQGARVGAFEAAASADVRTILSAEAVYQASSGGAYGELRCLAQPATCLPGSKAAPFVTAELASLAEKAGYRRRFYPGERTKGGLASFAYTAVPVTPGETGNRGFCGDDTGRICFTEDGTEPPVVNGRCAPDCQALK